MMYSIVLSTTPSKEESERILQDLLEKRLVACGNIVENVTSKYWWKGRIETSNECLLILKTESSRVGEVMGNIKRLHSYDVPEIIAAPISEGNVEYFRWVSESVGR